MFENLLNQDAVKFLTSDIKNNKFPQSVLFSGTDSSGKLTAALEVARIFSCTGDTRGKWKCECPSCLQHKALINSNMLLLGPRDCALEIAATKDILIKAVKENPPYLIASRYAFLRSIRKLTLRFNAVLWEGHKDIKKIAALMEKINDSLEELDFPRELPPVDQLESICSELQKNTSLLEDEYLYNSVPIDQIRNLEIWAHRKSESGKKTIIIENCDKMLEGVRNALLKIIEEPPKDCIFILLTSKRNAVMPTILSRVRTYAFNERSKSQQLEVIKTIFRNDIFNGTINEYLLTYLPVPAADIRSVAKDFYSSLVKGHIPDIIKTVSDCKDFIPRISLKIFLNYITELQKGLLSTAKGCEAKYECSKAIQQCFLNVTLYNQRPQDSLDILVRELSRINVMYGKILCVDM